jgi:hypothetical protein
VTIGLVGERPVAFSAAASRFGFRREVLAEAHNDERKEK